MTDAPATVWARENPVWATVFPVAQTVVSESPPVRPVEEGGFRVDFGGILRELTKRSLIFLDFTTNCQNLMRHAGVISECGSRWWLSCPFSRLTNVKGVIAHCPAKRLMPCAENSAECCNFADGSPGRNTAVEINPSFNYGEFAIIKGQAGLNRFCNNGCL